MKPLSILGTTVALVALSFATLQPALADPHDTQNSSDTGLGSFEEALSGEEAVEALGDDLEVVADSLDLSTKELEEVLQEENTSVLPNGRIAMAHPAAPAGTARTPIALAADWDVPLANVFKLESKPGSSKTIYLDFDGDTMAASNWWVKGYGVPRTVSGYTIDSNPKTFNDEERRAIAWIWAQVAEDFAPFDVNVTTKRPANLSDVLGRTTGGDSKYGAHVVITSSSTAAWAVCGNACSGVAFVGTFTHFKGKKYAGVKDNSLGRDYQPAWVFDGPQTTGQSAQYIADTASHEAGHNLGLLHSSNSSTDYYGGHNNWASIMGTTMSSGTYRPVSQWSNGHYPGARHTSGSSSTAHKDQMAVMRSHGLKHRADEVGDTVNVSKRIRAGYIGHSGDQDTIVIGHCPAGANITAETATMSNLDTRLELLNSAGTVVASSSGSATGSIATGMPTSTSFPSYSRKPSNMGTTISVPSTGVYYLRISGEGSSANNYPSYGSLGKWTVNSPCDTNGIGSQPGQAAGLKATPKNKAVTLTWDLPDTGRIQDLTGWRITRKGSSSVINVWASTRSNTITGLKNGYRAYFTVTPLLGPNKTPGTAVATVSEVPRTVPSAPKITKVSDGFAGGKISARVQWTAPASGGSPITSYRIYAKRYSGSKVVQIIGSPVLPATARKHDMILPYKADYRFVVKAVNSVGTGPSSKNSAKVKGR